MVSTRNECVSRAVTLDSRLPDQLEAVCLAGIHTSDWTHTTYRAPQGTKVGPVTFPRHGQ